jgi:hypothetical protein
VCVSELLFRRNSCVWTAVAGEFLSSALSAESCVCALLVRVCELGVRRNPWVCVWTEEFMCAFELFFGGIRVCAKCCSGKFVCVSEEFVCVCVCVCKLLFQSNPCMCELFCRKNSCACELLFRKKLCVSVPSVSALRCTVSVPSEEFLCVNCSLGRVCV